MENGAVYGPTTEEAPGPGRAQRRLPAACCSLHRLPRPRRALKLAALGLPESPAPLDLAMTREGGSANSSPSAES